jgi:hypothetical protein
MRVTDSAVREFLHHLNRYARTGPSAGMTAPVRMVVKKIVVAKEEQKL